MKPHQGPKPSCPFRRSLRTIFSQVSRTTRYLIVAHNSFSSALSVSERKKHRLRGRRLKLFGGGRTRRPVECAPNLLDTKLSHSGVEYLIHGFTVVVKVSEAHRTAADVLAVSF
jgi:hypothetical protein